VAAVKITKRVVEGLEPSTRIVTIYDSELKGFGVRLMPSGVASYIIEYRPDGGGRNASKKRMALGRVGELTPDEASKGRVPGGGVAPWAAPAAVGWSSAILR
jgi:hypothetical protein